MLGVAPRAPSPESVLGRQHEAAFFPEREAADANAEIENLVRHLARIKAMYRAAIDVGPPQDLVERIPDRSLANLRLSVHHTGDSRVYHRRPAIFDPIIGRATSRSQAQPARTRCPSDTRILSPSCGTKPRSRFRFSISQRMPGLFDTRL